LQGLFREIALKSGEDLFAVGVEDCHPAVGVVGVAQLVKLTPSRALGSRQSLSHRPAEAC